MVSRAARAHIRPFAEAEPPPCCDYEHDCQTAEIIHGQETDDPTDNFADNFGHLKGLRAGGRLARVASVAGRIGAQGGV
jgi:hypothetical protein